MEQMFARAIILTAELDPDFLIPVQVLAVVALKKISNLVYLSNYLDYLRWQIWESVVHLNTWHQHRISKLVVTKLLGTITQKKITVLGFLLQTLMTQENQLL